MIAQRPAQAADHLIDAAAVGFEGLDPVAHAGKALVRNPEHPLFPRGLGIRVNIGSDQSALFHIAQHAVDPAASGGASFQRSVFAIFCTRS